MAGESGPFRKIIVGTDGYGPASRAVETAIELAGDSGSEVIVVHVQEAHKESDLREPIGRPVDAGQGLLKDIAARHGDRVRLRTELRRGEAAEMLVGLAEDEGADLIVVGNKGMSKRFHLGIVPDRVSHHAPCNVLIVRTTED